ncbi:chemokine (c-c motif) ligand 3-like [Lynx pardinus]|nr:chemokine (c-c motif) ligand 3-like [Lynx pardinus]
MGVPQASIGNFLHPCKSLPCWEAAVDLQGYKQATPHPLLSIMKVPGAALAILLCTMALCSQVFSAPFGADTPTACCFSYVSKQIPRKFIADYFETSSQCSKPGVIFQTRRGRQVCADPSEAWVQEYVTDLELSA